MIQGNRIRDSLDLVIKKQAYVLMKGSSAAFESQYSRSNLEATLRL